MGGTSSRTNVPEGLEPAFLREVLGIRESLDLAGRGALLQTLLVSFVQPGAWTVVTQSHLIWRQGGDISALLWEEIVGVSPLQDSIAAVARTPDLKMKQTDLEVTDKRGGKHVLGVEPGLSYFLMWNVIQALAR
jgi:hypothetical protein